jgi:hypothetical protein
LGGSVHHLDDDIREEKWEPEIIAKQDNRSRFQEKSAPERAIVRRKNRTENKKVEGWSLGKSLKQCCGFSPSAHLTRMRIPALRVNGFSLVSM